MTNIALFYMGIEMREDFFERLIRYLIVLRLEPSTKGWRNAIWPMKLIKVDIVSLQALEALFDARKAPDVMR